MTGPGELSTRKFSNLNFPAVACPAEIIASWYYRRRLCSCDSQVETHSFSFKTSRNFVFCLLSFSSYSRFSLSSLPFLFFSFLLFISRICLTHERLLFVRFLPFTSWFRLFFFLKQFLYIFFIIHEYISTSLCVLFIKFAVTKRYRNIQMQPSGGKIEDKQ